LEEGLLIGTLDASPTSGRLCRKEEEPPMDKDRIEGGIKKGVGKAKEGWGDATDDPSTEAEGKKDQAEGELQQDWGKIKDKARDLADHD
jgi:uncharacterized protein YjbJ (UPF0337 family)